MSSSRNNNESKENSNSSTSTSMSFVKEMTIAQYALAGGLIGGLETIGVGLIPIITAFSLPRLGTPGLWALAVTDTLALGIILVNDFIAASVRSIGVPKIYEDPIIDNVFQVAVFGTVAGAAYGAGLFGNRNRKDKAAEAEKIEHRKSI